jgi:hypothetical protein
MYVFSFAFLDTKLTFHVYEKRGLKANNATYL